MAGNEFQSLIEGAIKRDENPQNNQNENDMIDSQKNTSPKSRKSAIEKSKNKTEVQLLFGGSKGNLEVRERISKRKALFVRRKLVGDVSLILAMIGLFLAVVNAELIIQGLISFQSEIYIIIKLIIAISTLILQILIAYYYIIDISITEIDNNIVDWRLALSFRNIILFVVEILVLSIYPWIFEISLTQLVVNIPNSKTILAPEEIQLDIILTILMFSRLYLLFRFLTLHHKIRDSPEAQILGPLNRVSLDFSFSFKAIMQEFAWTMMTLLILVVIVIASWTMHLCEYSYGSDRGNLLNTGWVVIITYFTIG